MQDYKWFQTGWISVLTWKELPFLLPFFFFYKCNNLLLLIIFSVVSRVSFKYSVYKSRYFCLCQHFHLLDFQIRQHESLASFFLSKYMCFQPHSLTSNKEKKNPHAKWASPPRQSSSSSGFHAARHRSLWPGAGLNYCNQRMNSNQQPCMSCWQNAWPPALSTNQTAASHSQLITMCTWSSALPSHLTEEALSSPLLVFLGRADRSRTVLNERWRCEMKLLPLLPWWQPWLPSWLRL